jgi:hypothetical protein
MDWTKNARGGADMKMILAVLFAVGGLSWAAVSFLSSRKDRDEGGSRIVNAVVDDTGKHVDVNYTKANSSKQVHAVQSEIENAIQEQAQAALSAIEVPKGLPDGLSDATINAFIPILSGDHDSFLDAIIAMGGKLPGDLEEENPLFTHLTKVFAGAKVDLSRITVERYIAPEGGRMQMRRQVTEDEEDGPGLGNRVMTQMMELQPASLFPDAPTKQDPTAIMVKIPVLPKGDTNESIFALVLTWNTDAKQWQPAVYQVIRNRLAEDD